MNPNSSYYLSFDTGYPNAFDRAHGRTGAHLMVHGSCSSRGCFAMTDEAIAEVYAIARESFSGGQRNFQFQSYPFRMTAQNLARHRADPNIEFWKNLKEGSDYFDTLREEPKVAVCGRRYVFGGGEVAAGSCAPQIPESVAEKRREDDRQVADLIAKGTPAIRLVYEDGGQHQSFREVMAAQSASDSPFPILEARTGRNLGDVSRPAGLAMGPQEIPIDLAKPKAEKPGTALAFAGRPESRTPATAPTAAARADAKAPQKPGTKVAGAAQPIQATAAAAAAPPVQEATAEKPFYKRVLGGLLN
jgi:hypothetical protein